MLLLTILAFSLLGSVGAVAGSALLLLVPELRKRFQTPLISYAVGTLLGATFMELLPRAIEGAGVHPALNTTLAGFVLFFAVEKILRIPHLHAHGGMHPVKPAGTLILWGDALHNFVDGVVMATAFTVSIPLGISTSLAVVAHEVPQELGDFAILLDSGWEPRKAFYMNGLSALATVPGALMAFAALGSIDALIPKILALSAASFLYIATTDIAPMLHHERGVGVSVRQLLGILLGIGTMLALHQLLH